MKIGVLIVDDSPVMRKAVRQLLSEEADIEIVGEAVSLSQMLEMEERYKPEIVIMDLHLIEVGQHSARRRRVARDCDFGF
jgi:DNA-binding NarL/FixJ family response regulator